MFTVFTRNRNGTAYKPPPAWLELAWNFGLTSFTSISVVAIKWPCPRQHCWICRSWRTSAYSRMRPILQDKAPARVGFEALSPLVRRLRRKSDGSNNSTPSSSIEFMTRTLLRCPRFRTCSRKEGSSTASPASGDWCQSKARMFSSAHCAC